jgi:adenylate cyclase
MLGTVGAAQHLEYRAVGDVVNSASRVQALNKRLGTTILATRSAVPADAPIRRRYLGRFRLAGKSEALDIIEIISSERLAPKALEAWLRRFESALDAFQHGRWDEAAEGFRAALAEDSGDAVSRFYLEAVDLIVSEPPQRPWDGVLRVDG